LGSFPISGNVEFPPPNREKGKKKKKPGPQCKAEDRGVARKGGWERLEKQSHWGGVIVIS